MTVDEVRAIRESISLEIIGMNSEELRAYFAEGAEDIERRIAEIRRKKGIAIFPQNKDNTSEQVQKNTHAYVRGAAYYANLSKSKTDIAVHENTEDYN